MPSKVKFLLVDDVADNLAALSAVLARDEVELLTATSGPVALELLLVHDVALALFDVQMPEMNGFELAELVRGTERTKHVPIIFVTGGVDDQHRQFKGYEAGAVDFLLKPIEPHVLRSKAEVFFQLEKQKQQLAQELEARTQTLRLNEMFTAVLGHDLRNPLNAILLGAESVQRRSTDEAVKKSAALMQASGRRMMRMIQALLDLARARLGGGIAIAPQPTDLGPLVERVVQEHRETHPGQRIEVLAEGTLRGEWDSDRLAQVVANLVGNALKHGTPDEPVRLSLDGTQADVVSLRVMNAGVIAPELLPVLFDPFRGSSQARADDGLGLGLFIVQQLVHAHGGAVSIECSGGRTTFLVQLPRVAPPPSAT